MPHGKIPLIASVSSLPEAGGDFAAYFADRSEADLVEQVERLIDDPRRRAIKEAKIREGFRPRRWDAIADEIVDWVLAQRLAPLAPFPAEPGPRYALSRDREMQLDPGTIGGERYRSGAGWRAPEPWGCWVKDETAEIVFSLDGIRPRAVSLGLRGLPRGRTDFAVQLLDDGAQTHGSLDAGEERRLSLPVGAAAHTVRLRLAATGSCDLAAVTDGMDRRVVRLGVLDFRLEG